MRRSWMLLVFALGVLGRPPSGGAQSAEPKALVDGLVRAWNAHDAKAFAAPFAEDADFVNVAGRVWKGRGEIQSAHEASHAGRFKASTMSSNDTTVRLTRPDVAVIHFRWEIAGALEDDGKAGPPRRGIMQVVAAKETEGWRIVAALNMFVAPPAPSSTTPASPK
jgi:uncharacterized protein (TIGR02246 family)